ncbi:3811_t:CDS:2 [Funneliformis caledonium]|uniref:3811_t:CDS:1 n=1 Tax=Funneliformis caledonium TaxID=1117310 RepID=A0A9N9DGJ6_9GLOM|nr:3811_t:CDS:2 [Funneliformis caledonium]
MTKKEKGVLKVTVIEAKNLKDEDKLGKSDPYVKLMIEGKKEQTTVKSGDLNPTYNEEFLFDIDGEKSLKLEVWDKDHIGKDDLIGKNDVKLSHAISKGSEDIWVTMREHTIGRSRGEVHLKLEFTPS